MVSDRPSEVDENIFAFGKKQRTVMLVEDSEVDRGVYRRYLEADREHDYSFIEVETGESALEIYSQHQSDIDIILLDYLLPDMDGLEWLSLWQEKYKDNLCSVIVLTGQGNENIAVKFIQLGAADYVVKGEITQERLQLSIVKAFAFKRLQRKNEQLITELISRNQELAYSNQMCNQEVANRQKLELILDNIPLVVYAKKIEREEGNTASFRSGKFWLVNREFCQIFQTSEAEIIGKSDREIFSPTMAEEFAANDHLAIKNRKSLVTEERVYHADGELNIYLSIKIPLFDDRGEPDSIVGIATNITQEKQIRAQLTLLETRFSNTFEQAAVGMAHVALDGRWLKVNQKLCEILGYTKAELLQVTFQDLTYAEDLAMDLEYVRQLLAGEIANYRLEKRYVRQNGSLVWINLTVSLVKNDQGEPEYFISVIEDISDRKNLELSRKKTLTRLANLHQIDKAIIEARQPKEIAAIAIERIQQFIPCQRTSIVTFNFKDRTARVLFTRGKAEQQAGEGLSTPLVLWQDAISRIQSSTTDYTVAYLAELSQLSQAIPVLGASGLNYFLCFPLGAKDNLLGILKLWVEDISLITAEDSIIVKEITSQLTIALRQAYLMQTIQLHALELEAKIEERTAQLEEINQELKAFSYSISHDLKAPLRAIQGFAIALQEDYAEALDDLGQEYTTRLAASAEQMEQLIQDILAYSRLSRTDIQKQQIDLSLVVDNKAIEKLHFQTRVIPVKFEVERPLLSVFSNRTILQQIVDNLLSNAIKFVPPDTQPHIRVWTEHRDESVRLWVEDNGIGIEPRHQERIFQVFERLHGNEAYPGTGIGLAIVKKGIERLGGRCGVESELNRGSRFWIELPALKSSK